jgi:serine/threonine-protein kinase
VIVSALTAEWFAERFPDLRNLDPLKQGGQKLVFACEHSEHGSVVFKLFHPHQPPESVEREIAAIAEIESDLLPRVHASGTTTTDLGQAYWLIEERVPGQSLRERLRQGALDFDQTIAIGLDILRVLVLAERKNIIHRDIKPDNIVLNGDRACLIDFGIARHLLLESLTATELPFGKFTAGYAPLEQFRNYKSEIDIRADLFGLGVTLYECICGRNPFVDGASGALDILRRVETLELPVLPSTTSKHASLLDFISSLTQKRKHHRPNTAQEALSWLEEIAGR